MRRLTMFSPLICFLFVLPAMATGAGDPVPVNAGPGEIVPAGSGRAVPVGLNDAYLVQSGGTLVVDATHGLLMNDFDPDGDPIGVVSAYVPDHGTLNGLSTNGSFQYTPAAGYQGPDQFSCRVGDGSAGQ